MCRIGRARTTHRRRVDCGTAAAGETNKRIAQARFVLDPDRRETHIRHTLQTLSITSREQLAEHLQAGIDRPKPGGAVRAAVHAALNGDRVHPATPRTPKQLAAEARAAVDAGAVSVHLHPYDETGEQTLGAEPCAMALRAVRVSCPGIPVSLSTSAGIEPDPRRRLELIAGWSELPELVTANQGEDGIIELCQLLLARGVGIEAGLLSLADARSFVASGLASRCARALIEPLDPEPETAVTHAVAIEQTLADAEVRIEQVHHGDGIASWAVNRRAAARGHGIRTGLEDTPVLPDGRPAAGNGELIAAAIALLNELETDAQPGPR